MLIGPTLFTTQFYEMLGFFFFTFFLLDVPRVSSIVYFKLYM